jgi:hypothetical protein
LSGTPDSGHCSSAATRASCGSSSGKTDVAHGPRETSDELRPHPRKAVLRCRR